MKTRVKEREFRRWTRMLSDPKEQGLLEGAFPPAGAGRTRRYAPSEDEKTEKKVKALVKKLKKAGRGIRVVRLALVLLPLAGIVIFNLFFLDGLVAGGVERTMEFLTGTDVDIRGLDLAPISLSLTIDHLSFADPDDPYLDSVVITALAADLNGPALLFRRLVFDSVTANIAMNRRRETAAVYPVTDAVDHDRQHAASKSSGGREFFDRIPLPELPRESVKLAGDLREQVQADYDAWTAELNERVAEVDGLRSGIEAFLNTPIPDVGDLPSWMSRIEEGRSLLAGVESAAENIREQSEALERAAGVAAGAVEAAGEAIEKDLRKIEAAFAPNSQLVEQWLAAVIEEFFGPRASVFYRKSLGMKSRLDSLRSKTPRRRDSGTKGRMKAGRIVEFPMVRPPRFSIRRIDLQGAGMAVHGRHVGIDHDHAGAPSTVELVMDDGTGVAATVDGRTGADKAVLGRVHLPGAAWSLEDLAGNLALDAEFSFVDPDLEMFASTGTALLSGWSGGSEITGGIIGADAPPLGINYRFSADVGGTSLEIHLPGNVLEVWGPRVFDSLLSSGSGMESIITEVNADLESLDALSEKWQEQFVGMGVLNDELNLVKNNLETALNEWSGNLVDIDGVPDVTDVFDALESLF